MEVKRIARAVVNKKIVKYVLIIPRWESLIFLAILIWADVRPLGPAASNHVWSTNWVAIFWPKIKLSLGIIR